MSEGGDTPSADEVVQSTSLNEETVPKADNKKSALLRRVGSAIGVKWSKDKAATESTEDLVGQLRRKLEQTTKECDRFKTSEEKKNELITKMEYEAKLHSDAIKSKDMEIENLKSKKPKLELTSGVNVQRQDNGVKRLLETITQVIRHQWMIILPPSIVCYFFKNDIVEIFLFLANAPYVILFIIFAILLTFKLVKRYLESKSEEIENHTITLSVKFETLVGLGPGYVHTTAKNVNGVVWKMVSYKERSQGIKIYLDGDKQESADWWCALRAQLRVVYSHKTDIIYQKRLIYDGHIRSVCIVEFSEERVLEMKDAIDVELDIEFLRNN